MKRRSVPKRRRTAFHEAGHAVLSAAINDTPRHLSIRPNALSLGRSRQQMLGRPEVLVQVHLAGYAAEQILTDRRPKQMDYEVNLAIVSLEPSMRSLANGMETCDGYRAVHELLPLHESVDEERLRRELDRFLEVAQKSLTSVWRAVENVARALMTHEELDSDGVLAALSGVSLYRPVFAVQDQYGLLPRRTI